jgi:hypothetical protein
LLKLARIWLALGLGVLQEALFEAAWMMSSGTSVAIEPTAESAIGGRLGRNAAGLSVGGGVSTI